MNSISGWRMEIPLLTVLLWLVPVAATQAEPAKTNVSAEEQEYRAAVAAAQNVLKIGPAEVQLLDQAVLKLPQGYGFIPSKEAARLMRSMGNVMRQDPVGMIVPTGTNADSWFVVVRFDPAGYIKDDDAKDWNAAELLNNIKEGTEAANEERRTRGIPELEILGWVEVPKYNAASHQLVWSISSKDKNDKSSDNRGINYNTYALGRDGYISMNLVTDLKSVEAQKPMAHTLLAGLEFTNGKRYADFNASTDKVAAYGLAALVGGLAAKKLGLFALMAAFFVKFAKVFILGGAAAMAVLGKWWTNRRNKNSPKA